MTEESMPIELQPICPECEEPVSQCECDGDPCEDCGEEICPDCGHCPECEGCDCDVIDEEDDEY